MWQSGTLGIPGYAITLVLVLLMSAQRILANELKKCSGLYIGGTHIQPQIIGHYILHRYTNHDRFVYQHQCADFKLSYQRTPDDSGYWAIGPSDTVHYVQSEATEAYPRDMTSWRSWDEFNQTWTSDSRLFISCTNLREACSSFVINGPDVPAQYRGPYKVHGIHNGHTTYKHNTGDTYVYHNNASGCPRWIVGPKIGDNTAVFMQSTTASTTPFSIVERWAIVHSETVIQQTYDVKLECIEYPDASLEARCGQRKIQDSTMPLILGGSDSYPAKWPFMVSYKRHDGVHKCGGAIVNRRWVITAGHCVSGADTDNETVTLGSFNVDKKENSSKVFHIQSVHVHPQFNWTKEPFRLDNDVALLQLDHDITYSDHIQPVCLPSQQNQFPFEETQASSTESRTDSYTSCHIAGWGKTSDNAPVSGILKDLGIRSVLNMADCYKSFYAYLGSWIKDSAGVCLFGQYAGRMCKGDSGTPLFCKRSGQWTLLGLGGWSLSDCGYFVFDYPSVYTDLSVFSDWVHAVIYGEDGL